MSICVLTQARQNSTRLPYKILKNINKLHNSITLLNKRLSFSQNIDNNIFIVPETDYILIDFLREKNINYEIGSESDLISRHLNIAYKLNIKTIIRITSDCPLVDFRVLDQAIELFKKTKYKEDFIYISNHTPPEKSDFPNGSDIEIFSTNCLTYIDHNYKDKRDREHVTFPMWDGREKEKIKHIKLNRKVRPNDIDKIRITLDNPEDLIVFQKLSNHLDLESCSLEEIEQVYSKLSLYTINGKFGSRDGWLNE